MEGDIDDDPRAFLAELRRNSGQSQQSQVQQLPGQVANRPTQPRVENGVRIFPTKGFENPTRSDVLARQFGMSAPEIKAFKDKFGYEPFGNYQGTDARPDIIKQTDPGRLSQLTNFLKVQREKGSLPESVATTAQRQGVVENLVVPEKAADQRAAAAILGTAANRATFGNLNTLQKPFTGADIPDPERLRTKVVTGADGQQVEVYDEEANPEAGLYREVFSPENIAGIGGDVLGLGAIEKGLAAGGTKLAALGAEGGKVAKVGQFLAGAGELGNVAR